MRAERCGFVCGMLLLAGCGGAAASGASASPAPVPTTRTTADSSISTMVPAGFGTLRQDDIALHVQTSTVLATLMPLDESIIRVLAPDSYRTLHAILESRRSQIAQRASMRGIRDPRVWLATFTGLAPDAPFVPTDVSITSAGREFRPFDVIPLTGGFARQRLQPRDTERGLLLFDEGLDVSQPLVVSMSGLQNTDWESILRVVDRERAAIRARAGGRP